MRLVPINPPSEEPLDATTVKARLSIGSELSDAVIEGFITAARQSIDGRDGWLGRAIMDQSWKLVLDGEFPICPIDIPLPPLISIEEVRYVDTAGSWQTLDPADYQVSLGRRAALLPPPGLGWPRVDCRVGAIEIEFRCGYEHPDDVPEPIKAAIVLMVSNLRSLSARNLFLSHDTVEGVGSKQYIVGGNAGRAIDAAVSALLSPYREFR